MTTYPSATYIGARMKRLEDPRFIQGEATFIDDIQLPGMLHATAVRSPHAHARILSIDVSAAEASPGVVAVVTSQHLSDTTGHVPVSFRSSNPNENPPPHPLLASGKVRYVGEAVALVIAETRAQAVDAAEQLRIRYEPLPVVVDPHHVPRRRGILLHEELGTNVLFQHQRPWWRHRRRLPPCRPHRRRHLPQSAHLPRSHGAPRRRGRLQLLPTTS